MKTTIFMATYNKNKLLANTLFSIARQKSSIPFEVCIIDDCSDVDPEPIIRKFIPNAKYKRLKKRREPDVVNSYALELASDDSDILIRQSADVMHASEDSIEQLCKGVSEKQICMAAVSNTNPPHDAYKNFNKHLPKLHKQHQSGVRRSKPGKSYYFFLGAIRRSEYESLKCTDMAHCDIMLADELRENGFLLNYPKELVGFHQQHAKTLIPCSRHRICPRETCLTKKGCNELGWDSFEDYLKNKH